MELTINEHLYHGFTVVDISPHVRCVCVASGVMVTQRRNFHKPHAKNINCCKPLLNKKKRVQSKGRQSGHTPSIMNKYVDQWYGMF